MLLRTQVTHTRYTLSMLARAPCMPATQQCSAAGQNALGLRVWGVGFPLPVWHSDDLSVRARLSGRVVRATADAFTLHAPTRAHVRDEPRRRFVRRRWSSQASSSACLVACLPAPGGPTLKLCCRSRSSLPGAAATACDEPSWSWQRYARS
jgi:hypothetical protein